MEKGEDTVQFAAFIHLDLDLADKYQRDSIAPHILDVVALFLPASKLWTHPQKLQDYWSSSSLVVFEDVTIILVVTCERVRKYWFILGILNHLSFKKLCTRFSIPKISQYFRTRSHVTTVDIDGWHARDLIDRYSLLTILTFLASFVNVLSSLTLLAPSTHLFLRSMEADFLCLSRNRMEDFTPSSGERSGVTASPATVLVSMKHQSR
jgi:hypothetical protein